MKLILTQEVAGLGGPGDVVEVKDGYGRNYLVPRGAAIRWTRGGEKQVSSIKRGREVREVRDLGHAGELKTELERLNLKLPVRAGTGGRLFGAVTGAGRHADGQPGEATGHGLRLLEAAHVAGGTGPTEGLHLLLGTARGHDGQPAGQEVVAAVAALDLDAVTGRAEAGDLLGEDQLHRAHDQRAVEV